MLSYEKSAVITQLLLAKVREKPESRLQDGAVFFSLLSVPNFLIKM